ncbi:MmgE/PrpD family protein [Candidatus Sumerlaeota bacterium]|nr:MmgE/PrpD family protein [Candidatus Sumerlaeota bacterium]
MSLKPKAERIAEYCLSVRRISKEAEHEAKRRFLDSFACAVGAWRMPVAPSLVAIGERAQPSSGRGAQIFGRRSRSLLEYAAFCNGGLVRTLDFNDTYLAKEPAHPSDNIAPLLAVAQVYGLDGGTLLRGIALSYEVQCRLCDANSLRAKGIDHVVYGAFSVAAGAGAMIGLSQDVLLNALGLAGVCNFATRQTREGEMANWKASAFSNAARNSLFALTSAMEGMTGPNPIFEGVKGMEKVITGAFDLSLPANGESPDMILKTYIKPFPVEYHAQSAVEAAIRLHGRGIRIDNVEQVVVRTHKASYEIIGSQPEKWDPTSKETADHSLPYLVAVALRDGNVDERSFYRATYRDPKLLAFLKRIKVVEDAGFTAAYGDKFANHLAVTLSNGEQVEDESHYPLGHPKNAMTDAQIEDKFRLLAEGLLDDKAQKAFIDACWKLDASSDLSAILPAIPADPGGVEH